MSLPRRRRALPLPGLGAIVPGVLLLLLSGCSREAPTLPTQPAARTALRASNSGDAEDEVLVRVVAGTDLAQLAADYGATLDEVEYWDCVELVPGAGETPQSLAGRLQGDPRVITAERNGWLETGESRQQSFAFDDGFGSSLTYAQQAAAASIGLPEAQSVSRGGGVRLAILDTGADLNHPVLAGRVVAGRDFVDGDYDPSDAADGVDNDGDGRVDEARGHGTHVAGIAALAAPDAELLIVRVLDADGRGDMTAVAAGIYWAHAHGARVVNLSLGSLQSSDAVQDALEVAEYAGVVHVAAAGNWGSEDPQEYPARSSHAVAVAAVDAQRRPAPFSSFGDHIALSAPGVGVRSAFPNGGYALWSGTSMAVPFVSGVSALLLALHPQWNRQQVEARLAQTARAIDTSDPSLASMFGAGVLDAAAALAPDAQPAGGGTDTEPPRLRRP